VARDDAILVIGLGRFGSAVAQTLVEGGNEVLAIDRDRQLVQEWAGRLTHVVEADATNEAAMRQLGADQFARAVVGIGTAVEASILTTTLLADLGVERIWAKAITDAHGKILLRVGAHEVVYPEREMGERLAHVVSTGMIDFMEFEDGWSLVETRAPAELVGRSLGEAKLRNKYGITVVGVKRRGEEFTYATTDTVIRDGDLLIVAGKTKQTEDFARST
jgi:trk system potassium uptake protein